MRNTVVTKYYGFRLIESRIKILQLQDIVIIWSKLILKATTILPLKNWSKIRTRCQPRVLVVIVVRVEEGIGGVPLDDGILLRQLMRVVPVNGTLSSRCWVESVWSRELGETWKKVLSHCHRCSNQNGSVINVRLRAIQIISGTFLALSLYLKSSSSVICDPFFLILNCEMNCKEDLWVSHINSR